MVLNRNSHAQNSMLAISERPKPVTPEAYVSNYKTNKFEKTCKHIAQVANSSLSIFGSCARFVMQDLICWATTALDASSQFAIETAKRW